MDISIFGYKLNLEILILIGVIYLILVGHTFGGCCRFGMMEGLDNMNNNDKKVMHTQSGNGNNIMPAGNMVSGKPKNGAAKVNGKAGKEGFSGANINYGQSSPYDLADDSAVNTSSWSKPDLTVTPGQPINPAVKQFLDRKQRQLPLPEGEMDFFANVEFKPTCCPNAYSNSTGCACLTSKDYNFLKLRGMNNTPYSSY